MKITHLTSSSVIIESDNVKILNDPWFLDGEYYGSWFHYPKFEYKNEIINSCNYIYISHIHPDHFSKKSLELLNKEIPVLIHNYDSKFLKMNLLKLGFNVIELNNNEEFKMSDKFKIKIIAADNCNPELCSKFFGCSMIENNYQSTQIDSMALIYDDEKSILNTNDCPYDLSKDALNEVLVNNPSIDLLLVGYAGAGPYPQCFIMDESSKKAAAHRKEQQFLEQGLKYINHVKPRNYMPFAGTYVLGGKLANLNSQRGVPTIENALQYFQAKTISESRGFILNQYESFDLSTGKFELNEVNNYNYSNVNRDDYISTQLQEIKFDYENDDLPNLNTIIEYIPKSFERFYNKKLEIQFNSDFKLIISLIDEMYLVIDLSKECKFDILHESEISKFNKFVKILLDPRLLLRILKGPKYAHWNNAEIGSHLKFERSPNVFERGLYHSYCYFHS
jgi:UDP-MurNAc hydroxylase